MNINALKTPSALIERRILQANILGMAAKANRRQVRLRPHVKTHKCREIALLQTGGAPGPITVSTLAEARFFSAAGFRDITYAVPIAPARLVEAAELVRSGVRLNLLVDHEETGEAVGRCAAEQGVRFPVLLKVDCGYHRAGVDPAREESIRLAARLQSISEIEFLGLLTHAGHSYHGHNRQEIQAIARQERDVMVGFARRLGDSGVTIQEISIGSTPTMTAGEDVAGISEIRPGNYVFFDAFQATIGSCALVDCAFSVLASVIGRYDNGRVLLDTGALALSKDPGARHVDPDCGFGVICPAESMTPLSGVALVSLSQEHGIAQCADLHVWAELRIGSRVRVVPNHSCLSAALFDRFMVVDGEQVVDEFRPCRGW